MPSDRTFVTEIATGLGMVGGGQLSEVMTVRPPALRSLVEADWLRLQALWSAGELDREFRGGFRNGQAFLMAADGLNGRIPRAIEWTAGRRPPGDEVVPADLRIDHVYLVSCKYLSQILHNPSPARLVEGLLSTAPVDDNRDWYSRTAPGEYEALYRVCARAVEGCDLPLSGSSLSSQQRRRLAAALGGGWPSGALGAYDRLCRAVSEETAQRWSTRIRQANQETVFWRLLRIGSVPYFVLGASTKGSMRLRIDTPWDWRQRYRLRRLSVAAQPGGQPRVGWSALCEVRSTGREILVSGHVEIRWSHGRFAQPPEAKVYLDCAHDSVPGYNPL
ncbi:MAG: hypothetical protein ACYCSF_05305 [Acidimicrobiales bacterium]